MDKITLEKTCNIYQPKTISQGEMIENGKYNVFGANGIIGKYDRYNHEESEVVVTCRGATCGTINYTTPKSWITGNAMVVSPKKSDLKKRFLFYYLKHIDFSKVITGTAQPQITRSTIKNVEIIVPNISSQSEIVIELDIINKAIENRKLVLRDYEDLIDSKFDKMFLEKIKNGNLENLSDLCEIITDGTHATPKYEETGVIFLSSKDVTKKKITWDNIKYISNDLHNTLCKRISPKRDDILLAKNGTTGIAAIVDKDVVFDIYVSLALIRLKKGINPKFMLYQLNSPYCKQQFNKALKGIGVPNLHLNKIRETLVINPEYSRQEEFVKYIENIEKLKELIEQDIKDLELLLESKMHEYFD